MKATVTAFALSAVLSLSAAPSSADAWLAQTAEYKAYERDVELSIKASGALVGYLLGCGQDNLLTVMLITSQEDYIESLALNGPPRAQLMAEAWFESSLLLGMETVCAPSLYKAHLKNAIHRIRLMREAGWRAWEKGLSGASSSFE